MKSSGIIRKTGNATATESLNAMNDAPPVSLALTKQGIPHRIFRHKEPPRSLEQAAAERGQRPQQVIRSILFRLAEGNYRLVLVAGPRQIDWKSLRRLLGVRRVTMATPEEVLTVTGYPIGAVGPVGLKQPIPILMDESVLAEEEISMGSGMRGVAVILRSADLRAALGEVEVVKLS